MGAFRREKILKIGLKLAEIEAKMHPATLYLETKFLACPS